MKNSFALCLALAVASFFSTIAMSQATVLTFEDLAGDHTSLADGYNGFNWTSAADICSIKKTYDTNSGYYYGTNGNISVYNAWGSSPTNIDLVGEGTFTFNGAQFTSAWYEQTLTFNGYNNGTLVYESQSYNLSTTSPLWVELNWSGIDQLVIISTNYQWDMDDFTFNEVNSVPEPTTFLLFSTGILGLAGFKRKE